MFRKNTAGQFIHFQGVDATTGGIKSGVTWTIRRCIDGTFAAGGGTVTEDGSTGWYKCALSQADTNGNDIGFNFTGTGAVPQTVNIVTTAADPTDSVRFGLTALPNAAANAAGGLPISAAGGLDLDEMNVDIEAIQASTAGLTFTVTNQVDVNVIDWKSATAPAMTGDAFARLGAPAGASVSADIAEIEAETDTLIAGVNATQINGNATAAANLGIAYGGLEIGTAQSGGASTITIRAGAVGTTNYWANQSIYLTGGTGGGQTNKIVSSSGQTLTVETAWTVQPDNTTTYIVLGRVG